MDGLWLCVGRPPALLTPLALRRPAGERQAESPVFERSTGNADFLIAGGYEMVLSKVLLLIRQTGDLARWDLRWVSSCVDDSQTCARVIVAEKMCFRTDLSCQCCHQRRHPGGFKHRHYFKVDTLISDLKLLEFPLQFIKQFPSNPMLIGHYANEAFMASFEVLRLPQQEVIFG